ncbi:MAG TPA: glycosyltransferase family 39 protein [Candidatus Acidoferrales bacterium]|nr:glycosyltransferase family 39 protein [Candidatus Acidoferrales bacterium]
MKRRAPFLLFLLLTAVGVARIVSSYRAIAQTSDETPNIACGMQYLDLGRYDYGAFHPPLVRLAIALGPYLYGARSQRLPDRWREGNAVLNSARRYGKALTLARLGILPFFVLASACVWLWGRSLLGEWGALAPVFLFTNIPPVLAHAGVATMDMAIGAGVCAALLAFARWLEQPTPGRGVMLGVGLALAFLSKFSSVLLVPVCVAAIVVLRARKPLPYGRGSEGVSTGRGSAGVSTGISAGPGWAASAGIALLVASLLIWAAYGFSFGRITEHVADDAAAQGGILARVPAPLYRLLERTSLPAPAIVDGLWQVHNHVEGGHAAYLLGRNSLHGWWYFFPVALSLKTPLALLILAGAGWFALFREKLRPFDWRAWVPAVAGAAILLVNLPTSLNIGVRYMLPLYPMLALTGGVGAVYLLRGGRDPLGREAEGARGSSASVWPRVLAVFLMLWTAVSAWAAHPDYLAYFNEFAGSHPERYLVDSDLDWGQDMNLLVAELKRRHVPRLHMQCLYTGDDSRLDLPIWDSLEPYQPVTGWVAISFTMQKTYGWVVAQQKGRGDLAFAWLDRYQPVARVGKSILLYDIPEARPNIPDAHPTEPRP